MSLCSGGNSGGKRGPRRKARRKKIRRRTHTDKIEFFKSTVVWNALGWDHEETCFYWQHKTAKTVIRVHCDALDGAKRETLSHAITAKRGSAKPLVEYLLDREGSAHSTN
jgi:sugar lactone lactonase YvrE